MKLIHLALLDGGTAWRVCFEQTDTDTGNIYYAFCQAVPLTDRAVLPSAVGGGWRIVASPANQRRLDALLPGFSARLDTLMRQGELFPSARSNVAAERN